MKLDVKLQLKAGQTAAVLHNSSIALDAPRANPEAADAVLEFAMNQRELDECTAVLVAAAKRDALAWLAYPKARQLNTDLNRDIVYQLMLGKGLKAVRQIAIDDTWSALRFKLTESFS